MSDKNEVQAKELLVLEKKAPEAGEKFNKNGHVLRVVQWVFEKRDGSVGSSVSLEKRELFLGKSGGTLSGKAKGFSVADLKAIRLKWDAIIEAMEKAPAPKMAADSTDGIEEVPF